VTPLGDVAALSAAVRDVLAAPDKWRQRATEAAALVRQRYGGASIAAEVDALYHDVLAAH